MGIGSARGEDRAVQAAELAISSPLLEASIDGAHGVLLSIQGGSDLGLFEINEAARLVQEAAHPEANIIFGAVIDDALGDEVRVTVIAAGFDSGSPQHRPDARGLGQVAGGYTRASSTAPSTEPSTGIPGTPGGASIMPSAGTYTSPSAEEPAVPEPINVSDDEVVLVDDPKQPVRVGRPPRAVTFDDADDLDVPDFLK
jgi:cell division protein FtsZ